MPSAHSRPESEAAADDRELGRTQGRHRPSSLQPHGGDRDDRCDPYLFDVVRLATRLLGSAIASSCATSMPWCASPMRSSTAWPPRQGWTSPRNRPPSIPISPRLNRSMRSGYSSDLILHAFATDRTGVRDRRGPDTAVLRFDARGHRGGTPASPPTTSTPMRRTSTAPPRLWGLMCLQVFLRGVERTPEELETLRHGARQLGAAFQNVNFLRDLADDTDRLHRGYLGGTARLYGCRSGRMGCDRLPAAVRRPRHDPAAAEGRPCGGAQRPGSVAALTRRVSKTPADVLYPTPRARSRSESRPHSPTRAVLTTAMSATDEPGRGHRCRSRRSRDRGPARSGRARGGRAREERPRRRTRGDDRARRLPLRLRPLVVPHARGL